VAAPERALPCRVIDLAELRESGALAVSGARAPRVLRASDTAGRRLWSPRMNRFQ
jgi:hypothetical protein